jgi:phosphate-selective porin
MLACAATWAAASPACQQPEATPHVLDARQQETFKYASQLVLNGRFAAAYGRFSRLADTGHLPSAQMALAMYRQGRAVFASDWDAYGHQLERWNLLVACDALRALP